MKHSQYLKFPLRVILIILLTSCGSGKKIAYMQDIERAISQVHTSANSLKFKPNDLITISVSAFNMEAAAPYNLQMVAVAGSGIDAQIRVAGTPQLQPYLIDDDGNIEFPQLGTVKVEGMDRKELAALLKSEISEFVKDPIVNVRIINFQVSVLGEVNNPGTFNVQDEYLSIPKALGLAGDMSIYGLRNNVLVVREESNRKTYAYLDLNKADIIHSPYYYLQQNDIVYVEPNKAKKQEANYNRNSPIYISIASVLVSLAILITR